MSSNGVVEIDKTLHIFKNALRPPLQVGIEGLLASELATALFSPPLEKIRHTSEAYRLLDKDMKKKIGLTLDDENLYKKIYQLALDFQNSVVHRFSFRELHWERVYVPFSFTIGRAPSYLDWIGDYEPVPQPGFEIPNPRWVTEYATILANDEYEFRVFKTYLYAKYGYLSISSYADLKTRFITWAMPIMLNLQNRIFRNLISHDIWSETLALVRGVKIVRPTTDTD